MNRKLIFLALGTVMAAVGVTVSFIKPIKLRSVSVNTYTGTQSCRPCHEKFYKLWEGSHHGLAMQPVTSDFLRVVDLTGSNPIKSGDLFYLPEVRNDSLFILEYGRSTDTSEYQAIHAMGGKYVYYFLTMLEKGRLQVLPLAFDLEKREWYDNPGSGVRHFESADDEALKWKNYMFTFNTSCFSCHVSQLTTNFSISDMTYNTEWQEPGINCESCHGPAREHINVYAMADSGEVLTDGKIISTKHFSPSQHNSSCGSCHAKMIPVRESFIPGTDFYDAFDLVTVENPDFYPDGRDLGENYTFTSWEMNSCKDKSNLNCITCHTSSGRNKFRDNPNSSCLPCHEEKVSDPAHHTRHNPEGEGSLCISCHMPRTEFARMKRSDHSFRPPTPAATMEFGSPNACNICHSDKSARWANEIVVKQRGNYQYEILKLGRMMKEARLNDWKNAKLITEDMKNERINKVFATAFIRLAERYEADQMNEAILAGTKHPSPLVRAAAAHAMTFPFDNETIEKLIDLSADSSYIVRLSAGYSLAKMPFEMLLQHDTAVIIPVIREYAASLVIRKDHWGSWYNLGNFYAGAGDAGSALTAYDMALAINPEATVALVNAGFIYSQTGAQTRSEEYFLRALDVDSLMEAANLNLALLYGETGRLPEARKYLERTLAINPRSHVAAYNLAIIISDYDIQKALNLSKISVKYGNGSDKYQKLHDLLLERVSEKDRK